jgi:predicted AAA+ superfamily ATPase
MDKEILLETLQDWNPWSKELYSGVPREGYLDRALRFFDVNVVTALIGVRRSGKSIIMRQVIKSLLSKGTKPRDILFINFEDSRFPEPYPEMLDEIFNLYLEKVSEGNKPYVFLDEVHYVPRWEKWVRSMHELGKAKIMVSGSSSKLLSGELATSLTGRHLDIRIQPASFAEFLRFKNSEPKDELDMTSKKIELRKLLNEYIEYGGFPEVINSSEKTTLLQTYYEDILSKDIEARYNINRSEKLRSLARYYLTNISSPTTYNSLKNSLDTTVNTIEKYTSYLQEANMVFFTKKYSYKVKEQEKAARKIYSVDVGLSNAVGFRFSANTGRTIENIVALELIKRGARDSGRDLYYWKDYSGKEVDFVLTENRKATELIQVSWNTDKPETLNREITSLIKAGKELKCDNLQLITENKDEKTGNITSTPLIKWLLTTPKTNKEE